MPQKLLDADLPLLVAVAAAATAVAAAALYVAHLIRMTGPF